MIPLPTSSWPPDENCSNYIGDEVDIEEIKDLDISDDDLEDEFDGETCISCFKVRFVMKIDSKTFFPFLLFLMCVDFMNILFFTSQIRITKNQLKCVKIFTKTQ